MAIVVPTADQDVQAALTEDLAAVEEMLLEQVTTSDVYISAVASHVARAGGKRFRPMMVLLASHFGSAGTPPAGEVPTSSQRIKEIATVVELTHLATLYHDDVMDEATLRRGRPSANARFGNSVAILTGDFLFARASLLLAQHNSELVAQQAETMQRLVTGQIHETQGPGPGEDPVRHYLSVAADKTASLVAASARMGAMVAGAPAPVVHLLAQFGERLGLAFQLADDLLDVVSQSPLWGKTPGQDLREGVASLPLVLAHQHAAQLAGPGSGSAGRAPGELRLNEQDHAWRLAGVPPVSALNTSENDHDLLTGEQEHQLAQLLGADLSDDRVHAQALGLLRRSRAVEQTRGLMNAVADQAQEIAAQLPDIPARHALVQLCHQVVSRHS